MDINSIIIHNPLTINTKKTQGLYTSNLIFVARLTKESKGLDFLLDILEQLYKLNTNFNCYVLGDGVSKEWFVNELNKRKLSKNVILVGEVKDVENYYMKSSILLSTSRWEGFPLVLTEAMSCGVIPISFENGGSKEIIDNKINGYIINNYDTEYYAEVVNELLNNDEKRKALSISAIEKSKQYKTEEILKQWNSLFNS